jgi:hypothetical protein
VLQDKLDYQNDLEVLLHELDGISTDVSQYVNFLVQREYLMHKLLLDDTASNN